MKKTRNCLICNAPTVANNKLCKKTECLKEQLSRRIHIIPSKPGSGVFLSLTRCTHDISLEEDCERCEREWVIAQREANPRINHGKSS
jgi:hypothetical protein